MATPQPPRALPGRSTASPAQRKLVAGTCLLRGDPLEGLARRLNISAACLSEWRDRALVGAETPMTERERDSRGEGLLRLKAKLGETAVANESLDQKNDALEGGRPLGRRRSRR